MSLRFYVSMVRTNTQRHKHLILASGCSLKSISVFAHTRSHCPTPTLMWSPDIWTGLPAAPLPVFPAWPAASRVPALIWLHASFAAVCISIRSGCEGRDAQLRPIVHVLRQEWPCWAAGMGPDTENRIYLLLYVTSGLVLQQDCAHKSRHMCKWAKRKIVNCQNNRQ